MTPTMVIYLDRSRLQIAGGHLSTVISLDFPPDTVTDLEVKKRDLLNKLVKDWITKYKIVATDAVLVAAESVYLSKDIGGEATDKEWEIKSFTDLVPFEEPIVKQYPLPKGIRVVAVNRSFVDAVGKALAAAGIHVTSIIPSFLVPGFDGKRWLDNEMARSVLGHKETYKGLGQTLSSEVVSGFMTSIKRNQLMLYILLGVFGVLIIILIGLLVTQ